MKTTTYLLLLTFLTLVVMDFFIQDGVEAFRSNFKLVHVIRGRNRNVRRRRIFVR
uniref:Uncharacterized protein n=1 Tax=Thermobia domestica TaxID=89055 RepID=A4FSG5_THEDO|nr:hypothetical protein [Thermobia domestica]